MHASTLDDITTARASGSGETTTPKAATGVAGAASAPVASASTPTTPASPASTSDSGGCWSGNKTKQSDDGSKGNEISAHGNASR